MSFFSGGAGGQQASNTTQQPPQVPDIELVDPPPDSISAMAFSPQADLLAVASWDNNVRIYEIGPNGQSQGKSMYSHEGPVLDVCWSKDGTRVFSGGGDKAGRMYDLQTGQSSQVAAHDAAVRNVRWIETPQGGFLVTGSWDKTIKYWDTKSPNPVQTVNLPERCYTLDVSFPLLVVGTAERHVIIINLTNPGVIYKQIQSPLKWQTRTVACFPTADGFAIGSVEGRVAIQYVEEKDAGNNFSFKCHRKEESKDSVSIFAVNAISFHLQHGTFSTGGADGTMNFWDKDSKIRLKSFDAAAGPIACSAFSRTGSIFAYAVSYDWSKGHSGNVPGHVNKIFLHALKDDEIKRKPRR